MSYCITSCASLYWNVTLNEIIELLLSTMNRVLLCNFLWLIVLECDVECDNWAMTLNEITELLLSTMDRVPLLFTFLWLIVLEWDNWAITQYHGPCPLLCNFRLGGGAKNHLTGTAHLTNFAHFSLSFPLRVDLSSYTTGAISRKSCLLSSEVILLLLSLKNNLWAN